MSALLCPRLSSGFSCAKVFVQQANVAAPSCVSHLHSSACCTLNVTSVSAIVEQLVGSHFHRVKRLHREKFLALGESDAYRPSVVCRMEGFADNSRGFPS